MSISVRSIIAQSRGNSSTEYESYESVVESYAPDNRNVKLHGVVTSHVIKDVRGLNVKDDLPQFVLFCHPVRDRPLRDRRLG